jgi:hypothetical protein
LKIVCDKFILGSSYPIGVIAGYNKAVLERKSWENKLFNAYMEQIHLLFINKKIQSEDDYLIFNSKNQFMNYPEAQYVANEENRDYQLNQLTKRLQTNCLRIVNAEIDLQSRLCNRGNVDLLYVLKDIANRAHEVDF